VSIYEHLLIKNCSSYKIGALFETFPIKINGKIPIQEFKKPISNLLNPQITNEKLFIVTNEIK
jgi:hypothetical protein